MWPRALGVFILNEIDIEILLSSTATIPTLRERHLCQAYFVIALKELEKGNVEECDSYLRKCVSMGAPAYLEQMYYSPDFIFKPIKNLGNVQNVTCIVNFESS